MFLPRDAMHKYGLLRLYVMFVYCCRNKSSKFFRSKYQHHSSFPHQTWWQYSDRDPHNGGLWGGGFEYRWDRKNSRFSTNIWLSNWWLVQCDQQYTVDAWCNRFRSHLAFVYRTERHLSVDLVYHSPCSMDDYAKENRAQFNCLHWWIWGRIN